MGSFRENNRPSFGNRSGGSRFGGGNRGGGGRSFGGGGFGGRGGDSDRRKFEEHQVTCDKCGKECMVPFKPTSGKPIYCRACMNTNPRTSSFAPAGAVAGVSAEQFNQLNTKLDKIIAILKELEIVSEDEELGEDVEPESEDEAESDL